MGMKLIIFIALELFLFCFYSSIYADDKISLSLNKDISYYIETENDDRYGYDWEIDKEFSEIVGIDKTISQKDLTLELPADTTYYFWLNKPDSKDLVRFDVTIEGLTFNLTLKDDPESYSFSNLVYTPAFMNQEFDNIDEIIEVVHYPDMLPKIIIESEIDNGICSVLVEPKINSAGDYDYLKDIPVDILISHNQEIGEFYYWISALHDDESMAFTNAKFDTNLNIVCETADWKILASGMIQMKIDGSFGVSYREMQQGYNTFFYADLDGNDFYEITDAEGIFDLSQNYGFDDTQKQQHTLEDKSDLIAMVDSMPIPLDDFQQMLIITRQDYIDEYEARLESANGAKIQELNDEYTKILGPSGREDLAYETLDELLFVKMAEMEAKSMGINNTAEERWIYIKEIFDYGEDDYFDPDYLQDYALYYYDGKVSSEFLEWYFGFGLTLDNIIEKLLENNSISSDDEVSEEVVDMIFSDWADSLWGKYNIQIFENWEKVEDYPVFEPAESTNNSNSTSNNRRW